MKKFIFDTNRRVENGLRWFEEDLINCYKGKQKKKTNPVTGNHTKFGFIDIIKIVAVIGMAYLMLWIGIWLL
jgi:hypothetical protein